MPLSPQITITPEDITFKSFTISAVTYTSTTATYTATAHTLSVGNIVTITGLAPDGYNGTFTITGTATNTFTVANTTNTALTDQSGNVYWADATEYEYDGGQTVTFDTNNLDLADSAYNPAISSAAKAIADANTALANAATALSNAATAQSTANTALANAATAYNAAVASLQPSASTIVNASNQITAIAANGITVYSGASASSGARVVMNSVGIAGYDASNNATFSILASTGAATFKGSITGSSITGSTLNIGGNFYVDGTTGQLTATNVVLTGNITATTGSFTGAVYATTGTFTGTVTATSGSFTGSIYASSGYIGNATNGWNFSASGYMYNSTNTTILYPSSATNSYALITDRAVSTGGVQSSGDILTTGSAKVTGQGTSGNRCEFNYYNTIVLHSISSGYGVDSDWAPNSDNTYNLGQATSAGYGANRRWARLYSNNTTISTSDVRLKTDVNTSPLGLDFINSLRPVSYRWIVGRQEVVKDEEGNGIIIGETPEGKPIFQMQEVPGVRLHYGFIAQEVKEAVDASGVQDFAGWVQDDMSDPDSTQSLSYEQFIAPLTKAVQELSARVAALEAAN